MAQRLKLTDSRRRKIYEFALRFTKEAPPFGISITEFQRLVSRVRESERLEPIADELRYRKAELESARQELDKAVMAFDGCPDDVARRAVQSAADGVRLAEHGVAESEDAVARMHKVDYELSSWWEGKGLG